ncbi:MAG: hypothetical protein IPJ76_17920 [Flavobacteriales bacterium]|nr:MAG: hypothetical protein IPJ76_17920 [Flavobacteriales bacterium]
MKKPFNFQNTLKWTVIYSAVMLGLWWLHHPLEVGMEAAASAVKFVYQQF